MARRPAPPRRARSAAAPSAAPIAGWRVFGVALGALSGRELAGRGIAGSLLENSPGVDEVVAFTLLLGAFPVAASRWCRVLWRGVIGALARRGAFVAAGAASVETVDRAFPLSAAVVALAGARVVRAGAEIDVGDRRLVRTLGVALPVAPNGGGGRPLTHVDHRCAAIPLPPAPADFASRGFAVLGLCSPHRVLAAAPAGMARLAKGLCALSVPVETETLARPVGRYPAGGKARR